MSNISDKEQHVDALLNGFFERSGEAFAQLEAPADFEAAIRSAALRAQMPAFAASEEEPAAQSAKPFWRKKRFIGAIAAVACLAIALTALWPFGNEDFSDFTGIISIRPALAYSDGIDPAEGFIITTDQPISTQVVEDYLQVEPAFSYTVKEQEEGTEYLVEPTEPLESDTVYRLALDPGNMSQAKAASPNNTWAFQTISEFSLSGTLPRDKSNAVLVNSSIELYFTQDLDESAANMVSIEPALAGSWVVEGACLRFVPEESMQYDTVYTVTAQAGIGNKEGDKQIEEETVFRFFTQHEDESLREISMDSYGDLYAFSTEQIPWFYFWTTYEMTEEDLVDVVLYRFADAAAYTEALAGTIAEYTWAQAPWQEISTEGLQQVSSFSTNIINSMLYLPEPLEAGWYVIEARFGEAVCRELIQVSDLSAYMLVSDMQAIVWANDLQSGEAISGASILADGTEVAKTDADGVAVWQYEPTENNTICTIQKGDQTLIIPQNAYFGGEEIYEANSLRQAYWHYIYSDRTLYKPGDTVNLFGVLQSRDADYEEIEEVELQLQGYGLYSETSGDSGNNMFKQTVRVEDGVFDASFQLPVLEPGYYDIYMMVDGVFIDSCSFEVDEYTKPAYQIEVTPSAIAVMAGEEIVWDIAASFYDGTPYPNTELQVYARDDSPTKVYTDENGQSERTVETSQESEWYLISNSSIDITSAASESGTIRAWGSALVFNSDIELEVDAEREGNQAKLRLQAYSVDPSGISNIYHYSEKDYLRDFTGSTQVEVVFYEQIWHQYEDGQVYDPYTKTYTTQYRYELEEREASRQTVSLNGSAAQELTVDLNSENAYLVQILGQDASGRSFARTAYINAASVEANPQYIYYSRSLIVQTKNGEDGFMPGDTVESSLLWNSTELKDGDGRNLFFRARKELVDYTVTTESSYSYTFEEEYIPNMNLYAVHFDGETYYVGNAMHMVATELLTLQLEMESNKDYYAPGETATLTFHLSDAEGNPVQGAINVNLVDEALLAIRDQEVDILEHLLSNTYSWRNLEYISHLPKSANMEGAEGGGEGDGGRTDFRDTALFEVLHTDANGTAQVEVQLPDNITSWRIICQAYGGDAYSATEIENIAVGLPFFVDARLEEYYLAGDAPSIGVRSAGDAVGGTDSVTYTVAIPALGVSQTVSGPASSWTEVQLPELPTGEYEVQISGSFGQNTDSLSLSFAVYETKTSHYVQESVALKTTTRLNGSEDKLTTIFFSDEERALALRGLLDLSYQDNIRLEQRLSSYLAREMLAERFPDAFAMPTEEEKEELINQVLEYEVDHGLAVLPYGEADLEASVLAASFAGDLLPQNSLNNYFYQIYSESESDKEKTLALWGQAALGRPVLHEIDEMLQSETLDGESRLNLICALYFAGDGAGAAELALDFVNQWTEPVDTLYRAAIESEDRQQVLDATAKLALLANIYDLPQANGLYEYLLSNRSEEDYYLLEQLGILQARLDRGLTDSKFTYKLDGEKVEVDLSEQSTYALTVFPEQLAGLSFLKVEGNITATTFYEEPGLPSATGQADSLHITRTYPSEEAMQSSLANSGRFLVKVEFRIEASAPDGYYTVHDFLPAGLTYVETLQNSETPQNCWQTLDADKELIFGVYKSGDAEVYGTFSYYVRSDGAGTYKAESAYLSHSELSGVYAKSSEQTITLH